MAKTVHLDEEDRKLLAETMQKLDDTAKLMGELMEILSAEMVKVIKERQERITAEKVKATDEPNKKAYSIGNMVEICKSV